MNRQEYNGWTNYETWNWRLWYGDSFDEETVSEHEDVASLANYLKDFTEEQAAEISPESGFFADIINASISEVNFDEIAEHLFEDFGVDGDGDDDDDED